MLNVTLSYTHDHKNKFSHSKWYLFFAFLISAMYLQHLATDIYLPSNNSRNITWGYQWSMYSIVATGHNLQTSFQHTLASSDTS